MFGMRQRESRLDIQRLDVYSAHQAANLVAIHVISLRPQLVANLPASLERIRQMNLVDPAHKFHLLCA